MKKQCLAFLQRSSMIIAVGLTVATVLAFMAGYSSATFLHASIPLMSALWCAISAVLVTQVTQEETLSAAWLRLVGSLIGALMSGLLASWLGYTLLAFGLSLFLTIVLCSLVGVPQTFRLACLTIVVIMVTGKLGHTAPWLNALTRFGESSLGTVIAIVIAFMLIPLQKKLVHAQTTIGEGDG